MDINDDEPIHGEDEVDDDDNLNNRLALPQRWTCEACGCNTNVMSDRNCTICGTSNTPPNHFGNHFHPGT
jgi:rubrerythrin